jgi:membrane-associated protease RseP (regulator of RpoE activity)
MASPRLALRRLMGVVAALLPAYAAAFQQPGLLAHGPASARATSGIRSAVGAPFFARRAALRAPEGRPSSRHGGVQGVKAQADVAANFAASVASGASSLSGAAVLCGVIAFHELGHFLAAKVQGIRINDFSIGFGPKLVGFEDRDGVTYSFRLFPLGGYVSFPEGIEVEEGAAEEGKAAAAEEGEKDEKVYDYDDPDLIQNRPALQRALVISAGVIFNMILSYSAIFASVTTIGISTPVVYPGVAIPGIADPNGAAARSGLQPGDVIVQIDGKDLLPGDNSVREVVQTVKDSKGRTLHFMVQRAGAEPDDELEAVDVVPDKSIDGNGVIGVRLATNIASIKVRTSREERALSTPAAGTHARRGRGTSSSVAAVSHACQVCVRACGGRRPLTWARGTRPSTPPTPRR